MNFHTAAGIIAIQGGPAFPTLHQAIARLEARAAVIRDNDTALATIALGEQSTADTNQCLAWLASFRAPLNPAIRSILNTVHTTEKANAMADALVWHQQIHALHDMVAAETGDSPELDLYRTLLIDLAHEFSDNSDTTSTSHS